MSSDMIFVLARLTNVQLNFCGVVLESSKIRLISFLFTLIMLSSSIINAEDTAVLDRGDLIQKRVDLFEKECGYILVQKPESVDFGQLKSCELRAKDLNEQVIAYEKLMYSGQSTTSATSCIPDETDDEVSSLIDTVGKVTTKVKCTEKEIAEKNKDCGKKWECNAYRSIATVSDVLPLPIRWPVNKYMKYRSKSLPKDCLDKSKPNCLTEVLTSIVGNLMSTAKSLLDVAKYGLDSLMNIGGWFSKKSDSMHAAGAQKVSSVKKFLSAPGQWFSDFFTGIKKSMTKWVMNTVYCQKWEGLPHMSKCIEAYEGFKCIGCEDSLNAICSAAGVIISELGVAILTAGAGTGINIAAKASAHSLKLIAKKTATKIKGKSPNVGLPIDTKKLMANKYVSKIVTVAKLSKAKISLSKAKLDAFLLAAKNTKFIKGTGKVLSVVADTVADPLHIIKKRANHIGYTAASKGLSKVGKGKVASKGTQGVKMSQRAKNGDSKADKVVTTEAKVAEQKLAFKAIKSKQDYDLKNTPQKPKGDTHTVATNRPGSAGPVKSSHSVDSIKRGHETPKISSNTQHKEGTGHKGSGGSSGHSSHGNEKGDGKGSGSLIPSTLLGKVGLATTVGAGVTADITAKVSRVNDEAEEVAEVKQQKRTKAVMNEVTKKFGNEKITSKTDLLKALNVKDPVKQLSSPEVRKKIESMRKVYSEENRDSFVKKMKNMDPNITSSDANNIFNQRQAQMKSAQSFVNQTEGSVSSTTSEHNGNSLPANGQYRSRSNLESPKSSLAEKKKVEHLSRLKASTEARREEIKQLKEQLNPENKARGSSGVSSSKPVKKNSSRDAIGYGGRPVSTPVASARRAASNGAVRAQSFGQSGSSAGQASSGSANNVNDNYIPSTQRKNLIIGFPEEALANKDEESGREPASVEAEGEEGSEVIEGVNVPSLLTFLEDDETVFEENSAVTVDIDSLSSTNEERVNSFKNALNQFGRAKKKISFKDSGKQYYIYEFENSERFKILETDNGPVIID